MALPHLHWGEWVLSEWVLCEWVLCEWVLCHCSTPPLHHGLGHTGLLLRAHRDPEPDMDYPESHMDATPWRRASRARAREACEPSPCPRAEPVPAAAWRREALRI